MGLLTVAGTLSLDQFWPEGESDADTAKVKIHQNAFRFRADPSGPVKTTHVFDEAKVKGKLGPKPVIDHQGRITVRFQGIDATELHFAPAPLSKSQKQQLTAAQLAKLKQLNKKYRQFFGETATVHLHDFLATAGQGTLPCSVTTAVNSPNEVFDVYARFVGDVHVNLNQNAVNLNHWLVEQGWAFPTFYASMSKAEIHALLTATQKGRQKPNRLWNHLRKSVGSFDESLRFRGKGAPPDPTHDVGSVLMPKLFRRLCTFTVDRKVGIVSGNFHNFLKNSNPADDCFLTADFLGQGASASAIHFLSEFVAADGKISKGPQELVFRERESALLGPHGQEITDWQ